MSYFCRFSGNPAGSKFLPLKLAFLSFLLFYAEISVAAEISINLTSYQVELAKSSEARRQGLMFRKNLQTDHGMLLVYPSTADHHIWMKNMLIPLTLVWIGENYRVIDIQTAKPCRSEPCVIYSSAGVSRYVLELTADPHDVEVGDRVEGIEAAIK